MRKIYVLLFLLAASAITVHAQTTVVLVRHAEKVMEGNDPGLTPEGMERAEQLATTLSSMEIDALYSTPYARTRQTLEPLAAARNLEIQEYPPVDKDRFMEIIRDNNGKVLVFSGHSNTVPMLMNLLTGNESYETFPDWEYDNLFIVTLFHDHVFVTPLKYGQSSVPE